MNKLISRFFFGTPQREVRISDETIYLRESIKRLKSENELLKIKLKVQKV